MKLKISSYLLCILVCLNFSIDAGWFGWGKNSRTVSPKTQFNYGVKHNLYIKNWLKKNPVIKNQQVDNLLKRAKSSVVVDKQFDRPLEPTGDVIVPLETLDNLYPQVNFTAIIECKNNEKVYLSKKQFKLLKKYSGTIVEILNELQYKENEMPIPLLDINATLLKLIIWYLGHLEYEQKKHIAQNLEVYSGEQVATLIHTANYLDIQTLLVIFNGFFANKLREVTKLIQKKKKQLFFSRLPEGSNLSDLIKHVYSFQFDPQVASKIARTLYENKNFSNQAKISSLTIEKAIFLVAWLEAQKNNSSLNMPQVDIDTLIGQFDSSTQSYLKNPKSCELRPKSPERTKNWLDYFKFSK